MSTVYIVYIVDIVHIYTLYTLYTMCSTLYTLYTLYTMCTLYTLYTLYTFIPVRFIVVRSAGSEVQTKWKVVGSKKIPRFSVPGRFELNLWTSWPVREPRPLWSWFCCLFDQVTFMWSILQSDIAEPSESYSHCKSLICKHEWSKHTQQVCWIRTICILYLLEVQFVC